jgi:hypothetical protein
MLIEEREQTSLLALSWICACFQLHGHPLLSRLPSWHTGGPTSRRVLLALRAEK